MRSTHSHLMAQRRPSHAHGLFLFGSGASLIPSPSSCPLPSSVASDTTLMFWDELSVLPEHNSSSTKHNNTQSLQADIHNEMKINVLRHISYHLSSWDCDFIALLIMFLTSSTISSASDCMTKASCKSGTLYDVIFFRDMRSGHHVLFSAMELVLQ